MTKTLVIASRKGGAGKSTIAMHLSVLAGVGGARVQLVDTDPQGSLVRWYKRRGARTPEMVTCAPSQVAQVVERAQLEGVAYCIVDTPPHAEASILDAMRVADLVLVPTRPLILDLEAVVATLSLARRAGKTPLVVVNHAPPSSAGWIEASSVTEARTALDDIEARVTTAYITQRVALSHAQITGQTVGEFEPAGKAAREIAALWTEINPQMEHDCNGATQNVGDVLGQVGRRRAGG